MSSYTYITQEGYDRLMEELEELKTTERQKIAAAIAEAREKGDLSENAEYKAAKDEQGLLELKINTLQSKLAASRILDESSIDTSQVSLLTTVTIRNLKNNAKMAYTIVPEIEANLKEKKISNSSPVGLGLMGKKVGEIAIVKTPRGDIKFEIVDISLA
ncbi:MAG TPA: transcription elongation factor GreA [Saprospiraceae bacterium]|nr:transcription elongation factor GreA [Saprospiraceae bacterium]